MKHSTPYGPKEFSESEKVSPDTLARLKAFADLLVAWNAKINLVSKSTIPDLWHRHILDSAQIYPLLPRDYSTLIDLGSGAGFPGLILSIMGAPGVHLIESDARKSAFLREAIRVTGASAKVLNVRIEDAPTLKADVITARALAPLSELLRYSAPFWGSKTTCFFLKGQHVGVELTDAHKMWRMTTETRPSRSDPGGTVVCVSEVRHVSAS
ncbi:MAG: 16S rRNA (guanine(527)-N(7))-methyltransferase RsmG [Rhodospirillaceae bacterium]|nr:16S rRNA (guanine(527)-N(7))-methyltransferase RsmG [Rhodospirillaceae bacterium]